MNRRTFLFGSAMTCGAIPLANPSARAARLPVSTVTVTILSITRESLNREAAPVRGVTFETSTFVAKARVVEVPHNEHGLTAGDVIDIHYKNVVRQPPDPNFRVFQGTLAEGQTVTLSVFGGGGSFQWREN